MHQTTFTGEPVRAAEAVVRVLEGAGIDAVFALPGGRTVRILDALLDHGDTIRTIAVRDEEIATIMAEASARLDGKPAVAMGQAAFMLSKAGIGMLEAHLGSTPMVILTDLSDGYPYSHHAPYQAATGDYGNWDAVAAFRAYTKYVAVARYPEEVVQLTQYAIKQAITGEPGPVVVAFHSSVFERDDVTDGGPIIYDTENYLRVAREPRTTSGESVERVANLIAGAERPVLIAGGGVRLSLGFDDLERLATVLGAPVVTTSSGKGLLAENHSLSGGVMGTYAQPAANDLLSTADLVIALGTKLGPNDTINHATELIDPSRQTIVHIDVEPLNINWTIPADDFLVADVRWAMNELSNRLEPLARANWRQRGLDRVAEARKRHGYFSIPDNDDEVMPPETVVQALRAGLPDDAIVTCDAGENRLFMMHYFQTRSAGTYLQPGASGGMGYALPAALAARLRRPDAPVVAVCGDGGFGMSMPAVMTAVEEGLPIVVVVMNNSSLGWVKNLQGDRVIATEYHTFDYSETVRTLGWNGRHVRTAEDFTAALQEAVASKECWLIDVEMSLKTTHKSLTSPLSKVVLKNR